MKVLDDITALAWSARKKGLEAFLAPAAGLAEGLILARDGSLVTLIEIDGALSATGEEELQRFVDTGLARWNTALLDPGHAIHITFERDPSSASLGGFMTRQAAAARAQGLDLADVLGERERRLASLVADETVTMACWTRPSALTRDQERRDRRAMRRRLQHWLPGLSEAQCPQATYDSLEPRHAAFLHIVEGALGSAGIAFRRLGTGRALAVIRRMTSGATADRNLPVTAEDPAPAHLTDPGWNGAHVPPLAPQIIVDEPRRKGAWIEIGARRYAAIDMLHGPRSARPFGEFAAALAAAGIPCRFSLLIEGGGLATLGAATRRIASAFLAFSSPDSRAVRDSLNALAELRQKSRAVVRLRLSLLTWTAIDEDASETARRASRAQQILEGWGECVATRLVGDSLETLAASVPGFACGGTAEPALAPLDEALRMFPIGRPAAFGSDRPNHLFRSPDGRMLPFSFETSEDHGLDLIYGVPGRGKSVLLNALNLAWCLQSGHADLPLVAVIDIGPSSTRLVSLLREALPEQRRHEAGAFRLTMTPECAINPFDTQLGCRRPLPAERQYLGNLLALILTPAGAAGVPDGAREAIGPMIDAAYRMRSDSVAGGEPALYTPRRDTEVDEALGISAVTVPPRATWWEIVDLLFAAGQTRAAARAQRFAVPLMSDLAAAVREPAVQALIGGATWSPGGESVTDAVIRILAAVADTWPIFFHPTVFDTAGARVAAIDLAEVAPTGSPEADRQTAAVYMLARHALTRHWWIDVEDVAAIPEACRAWHRRRLALIREAPKRLCFDEFHRAARARAVVEQVQRDVREARKLRVTLGLSSQRLEDFTAPLVELATRIWVLGAGGKKSEIADLARLFDLSGTLQSAVATELTGPAADGAPALLIAATPRGRIEQVVVNSPGAAELWALTTAPRDAALRNRLYRALPPAEARRRLAGRFPSGSARRHITAAITGDAASPETEGALLDRLAGEIAATVISQPEEQP